MTTNYDRILNKILELNQSNIQRIEITLMDQFLDFPLTYQEVLFQQNKYLLIYIKIISFMNVKNLFKNFFGENTGK